ncbi:MAG: response regulator transcription factor [Anaerolineales bacterium]|nr:response regulator transcription factor [Anaerolineales bacterium]
MTTQILIADDQGLLRAGLRALLSNEPDLNVIGEAENGATVLKLARELSPEVILLDISMPELDGIEATKRLKDILPDAKVLIITVHEDESLLQEAIRAGAAGYIVKRAVESELIDAIRAVRRGDMYIHPTMTRAFLKDFSTTGRAPSVVEPPVKKMLDQPVEDLTPRELDVLRLIAKGCTNRQMAEELTISVRTVEGHRANLMGKLNLQGRVELVRYAREHNLVE